MNQPDPAEIENPNVDTEAVPSEVLIQQRERARLLVRSLTRSLRDEHDKRCGCGGPSTGDCYTAMLLQRAQDHIDIWPKPDVMKEGQEIARVMTGTGLWDG